MKLNKDPHHTHEDVHDHNKQVTNETRSYWRRMMHSTHRAMSSGAQQILKLITMPHGDNWRRKNEKK